jgi:hypothetical protein
MKSLEIPLDDLKELRVYFNSRDLKFFKQNQKKIESTIKKDVKIKEDTSIELGGYILELMDKNISFNFTLKNIIQKNFSLIESKFTSIIADSKIKEVQNEFEHSINQKKKKREDILIEFDRI